MTRGRWVKASVAASIAALAPTALSTAPAEGRVIDVAPGHNLTVLHNIDLVMTTGHAVNDTLTVEVRRNGVPIGTTAPGNAVEIVPGEVGLEVNHGPEVAPAPGDCFDGGTPDIRPGDRIVVENSTAGTTDTVVVDNLQFTGRPRELGNNDIVVPFLARLATGRAIPPGAINSPEFRAAAAPSDVRFGDTILVQRRPGAGPGQLQLRYRSPFRPDRNRVGWNQAQLRRALLGDGHATGFIRAQEGMLVEGLRDTPGPALGCPGPTKRWQVSSVSPEAITPANRTRPFRASGRTFDTEGTGRVMVRLIDSDAGEPRRVVDKRATVTGNTWTVSFRPRQLRALDGRFRVSSLHTLNGETSAITGPSKVAFRRIG